MADTENTENVSKSNETEVLPQWARDQITEANKQAAKYRTEKNDAVEAAKQEVADSFQDKIRELEAQVESKDGEVSSTRLEVDRIKATLEAGIAADKALSFADLLKGENPEELRSHAEELKKLFANGEEPKSSKATDPSQGHGSKELPLNGDPLLAALTRAVNR